MSRQEEGTAIRCTGISKNYGKITAVEKLSLEVKRGEIYGFLGLNGAGKTTTIRMLLGLVRPSEGEIEVFGTSMRKNRIEVLRRIGFLVETASAYPNLTVRENLELQAILTGAPKQRVEELIELLGLRPYAERTSAHLSLGNKQRLSIARALAHSPELLVLDEPVNGLDPAGIVEVRGLLKELRSRGMTIFISSHILSEVDRLADRIGIIHEGRLAEELDRGEAGKGERRRVELKVDRPDRARALLEEKFGDCLIRQEGEGRLVLEERIAPEEGLVLEGGSGGARGGLRGSEIARALVEAGIGLEGLLVAEEGLEGRFMRITGGRS